MAYYYSASERAFFSSEFMTVGEMPADKVAVADGTWKTLVADQSAGKIIRTGASNAPESAAQSLAALTGYAVPAGMTVAGGVSATGSISAGGALTAGGTLTVKGGASLASASVSGTMDVTGTTNLKSTLTVAGKTTAKAMSATDISASTITTTGNASVGGTLTATGAATLNNTLNVAGKSTLKAVSATGIDATTVDTTGNSSVGGTLTVKGNATVGGKNVARSVDGVAATANGDVPLNAMAYKKLSSIQSVKGSFWFDHKSGIDVAELPENFSNAYWHGFQIGTAMGNDKAQFVFNSVDVWYRSDDADFGGETWTADSWQKITLSKDGNVAVPNLTANGSWMAVTRSDAVKGTIPKKDLFSQFYFRDGSTGAINATKNALGALEMAVRKSGHTDVKLYACKNVAGTDERAQFLVGWKKDGDNWVAYSTAPTTPAGATRNEVVTANFGNRQWLNLDGSNTMSGTIKSSAIGSNWVGAANGQTLINSTAVNGAFAPLFSFEATNEGSFVVAGYRNSFQISFVSKENKASNTNTTDWQMFITEAGDLFVPGNVTIGNGLWMNMFGSNRKVAYISQSTADGQDDFILAGANQATFICSGEGGYATEEMKAFRDSLRVGGEDIVLASDNNIVLVSNCNLRDGAAVKKAVLKTNGLFTLPVHPGDDTNDYTVPTTKWVRDLVRAAVPTGTILPFDGTNVPSGYLVCNGAAVSRTTYAALFAVLGTRHGEGDGKTTFNLPNAHRRFLEMTTTTSEVGETVEAGLPNITGQFRAQGSPDKRTKNSGAFANDGKGRIDGGLSNEGDYEDLRSFNASRCSALYGGSSTVQPPSLRALAIIKF
jgi:hypothetical protein